MISRLQELTQQAWYDTSVGSVFSVDSFAERFAQLIEAECLSRIEDLRGYSGYGAHEIVSTPDWNFAIDSAKRQISRLFQDKPA